MTTLDLLEIAPQLVAHGFRSGLLTQNPVAGPAAVTKNRGGRPVTGRRYLEPPPNPVTWCWIGRRLGITASAAHMNWRGLRNSHRAAVAELIRRHGEPQKRKRRK